MKKVNYAVVGAGWISQEAFMPAIAATGNSRLFAVVSGSHDAAEKLAEFYDIPNVVSYDDYDALLAMEELDAVYIALPNALHADYAIRAAKAGKHLLVEKPLAITREESQEIVDAARENGVILMTAYRLHMEPGTVDLINRIRDGEIGEPQLFTSIFSAMIDPANHRLDAKHWGGPLQDVGIYCLNAARHVFGCEPVTVTAMAGRPDGDARFTSVPAHVAVTLEFPGGRVAQFIASFNAADTDTLTVVGTKGTLTLDPAFRFETTTRLWRREGFERSEVEHPDGDDFAGQTAYLSDCILSGEAPRVAPEDGLADVHIMRVIEEALETGSIATVGPLPAITQPDESMVRLLPRTARRLLL